jgi:hypothetical protein
LEKQEKEITCVSITALREQRRGKKKKKKENGENHQKNTITKKKETPPSHQHPKLIKHGKLLHHPSYSTISSIEIAGRAFVKRGAPQNSRRFSVEFCMPIKITCRANPTTSSQILQYME